MASSSARIAASGQKSTPAASIAAGDSGIAAAGRCAPPDNKPSPEELGRGRPFLAAESVLLAVGQSHAVATNRPHQITPHGDSPCRFLLIQGVGQYDFVREE